MKEERRRSILLVDDDKHILKVLGDYLTFKGFDVVVAESGEVGLKKIAISPPDIILLDISMPGIGGIGFLQRIMLSNGTLRYPVLVFTARTMTEDYFRGLSVDGFIAKPCEESDLLSKVQEILEKHKRVTRKTILVGEDDPVVAKQLVTVLRNAGFDVETAATGPDVLGKAAVCLPDAIIVKQILTGMNGDAVVSILRAMPLTQSTPVVLYDASRAANKHYPADHLLHAVGIQKSLATDNASSLLNAVQEVLRLPDQARRT